MRVARKEYGLAGAVQIAVPARLIAPAPFGQYGQRQYLTVRLKLGEKKAKALKELTGNFSAQVLAPTEALMTVDNVLIAHQHATFDHILEFADVSRPMVRR